MQDRLTEMKLSADLRALIDKMSASWQVIDNGGMDYHWDLIWCELNAEINLSELQGIITAEQAHFLRKEYLRIKSEQIKVGG